MCLLRVLCPLRFLALIRYIQASREYSVKYLNNDLNNSPSSNVQVSQQLEHPYHAARSFSTPCSNNNSDVSLHRSPGTGQGRRHTVCARWPLAVAAAVRFEMVIFY